MIDVLIVEVLSGDGNLADNGCNVCCFLTWIACLFWKPTREPVGPEVLPMSDADPVL